MLLIFACLFGISASVYLYSENPYKTMTGPFDVHKFHIERTEYSTFVMHPTQPGNYSVLLFIGGFAGVIPSELYSELFKNVASHGIILVGFDMIVPWKKTEKFFKEYEFLKENLQSYISKSSKGVTALLEEYAGMLCHSGGCDLYGKLILENDKFTKGAILLDPVGYLFPDPMKSSIPTLITGDGIRSGIGCEMSNISCHRFYREWNCPKIFYNQTEYGHCAPVNPFLVKPCSLVCGGGKESDQLFQKWLKGIVVAWLSTVFKDPKETKCLGMKKYVFDTSYFPIKVSQYEKDLDCPATKHTCLVN